MDMHNQSEMNRALRALPAILGTVLMFTLLTACGKGSSDSKNTGVNRVSLAALKLNTLTSCDAYKTYATDALVEQYRPQRGAQLAVESNSGGTQSPPASPASTGAAAGSADSATPTHVTGTNNQETGVDEPDIVKTDTKGNLYIARGQFLRIVAGHPPTALKELGALDAGGNVYDLFLDEAMRRVVLFAAHYEQLVPVSPPRGDAITLPAFYQRVQYVVSFVDVSDLAHPVLTERWKLDGFPLDARHTDARIHVVLSNPLQLPASLSNDPAFWNLYTDYYNAPDADAASVIEQKIVSAIRTAFANVDAAKLLPLVTIEGNDGQTSTQTIVGCGDISAPKVLIRPSLLTVASFDTDGSNLSASAITADGATVYASLTHFYVTQTSGGWFNTGDYQPQTAIHQFSVSGAAPKYVATGVVDGWIQNSYNLSEYNSDLRVTTNTNIWSKGVSTRTNDLFILRSNGSGELAVHSAVRDFGKGEAMFSTRFFDQRAFVVTFRSVDPLFAFDLSDPDHPTLAGELTIPGFSSYMHPLGDNHLLTIGRDGATWGTQLQIFDVADLAHPQLAYKHSLLLEEGYSYSSAEYDPHAFTFDATSKVLAIPLSYSNSSNYFNGIAAFKIDVASGITELVKVDHADLANQATNCSAGTTITLAAACNYWYAANPSRSVIMSADTGLTLYSISDAGVKATSLVSPYAPLGSVVFPFDPPLPTPVYFSAFVVE